MNGFSIVITTCADAAKAQPIIDALLNERLAACVQVMPINSHYIWEGAVQHDDEALLLIKCKAENFEPIKDLILNLHEYELPEVIQVPITDGLKPYLDWVAGPR